MADDGHDWTTYNVVTASDKTITYTYESCPKVVEDRQGVQKIHTYHHLLLLCTRIEPDFAVKVYVFTIGLLNFLSYTTFLDTFEAFPHVDFRFSNLLKFLRNNISGNNFGRFSNYSK